MEKTPRDWGYIRLSMNELNPRAKDLLKDTLKAIEFYEISADDVCKTMNIVKEISRKTALENKKVLCDITQVKKIIN